MSGLREELRFRCAGIVGSAVVTGLFSTVRFEHEGTCHYEEHRRAGRPVLFVFWHDQLLPLVHVHRHEGVRVLVSEHADGEYIARVLERQGFETARGSSTRGGRRGLRELLRAAKAGRDVAIAPDGPRGPRHRFKEGAVAAARLLGVPLVPVVAAARSGWRLASWDRFLIPRPFSRVRVLYGPARTVSGDADREARRRMARELERELEELTARAAREVSADGAGQRGRGGSARTPSRDRSRAADAVGGGPASNGSEAEGPRPSSGQPDGEAPDRKVVDPEEGGRAPTP